MPPVNRSENNTSPAFLTFFRSLPRPNISKFQSLEIGHFISFVSMRNFNRQISRLATFKRSGQVATDLKEGEKRSPFQFITTKLENKSHSHFLADLLQDTLIHLCII